MAKLLQNFQMYTNEKKTLQVAITDPNTNLPVNLTTFYLIYRVAATAAGVALIEKNKNGTATDITVDLTNTNVCYVGISDVDAAALKSGVYQHFLWVKNPTTGDEVLAMTGTFTKSDAPSSATP